MIRSAPFCSSNSGKDDVGTLDINVHFPMYRGMRSHEYIVSRLSSAPYNESCINLSLGFNKHFTNYGVKILECSENQIYEVCAEPLPYKVFQTEWVPSHPKLLAVATQDIRFYEYENYNLTLKESYLEEIFNPVVSIDWNTGKSGEMLITRKKGAVGILSFECGTSVELEEAIQFVTDPGCGARFGTGHMANCVIVIEDHNVIKIFDHEINLIGRYVPRDIDDVLGIECSKYNDYLIAELTDKKIFLHDMRYLGDDVAIFNNFGLEEHATCLCWSPHSPEIYIGTSAGAIIKWRTNGDRRAERYYNQNKKIASIHCPEANSNFFLSTCFDSPTDDYARNIETYSIR